MPWKVLGQKWHLSRKGFPPGKNVALGARSCSKSCARCSPTAAPGGQFLWNNQQVVHLMVPRQREPWATIFTKRLSSLDLVLNGPKGSYALGRIAGLGLDREFDASPPDCDVIKLKFSTQAELAAGDLAGFLREHAGTVGLGPSTKRRTTAALAT